MFSGPLWFFTRDSQQVGPLSWEQLVDAAYRGALRPDDFVWEPFQQSWVPAGQISGLFAAYLPDPAPLPMSNGRPLARARRGFLFWTGLGATAIVFCLVGVVVLGWFADEFPDNLLFTATPRFQNTPVATPVGVPLGIFSVQPAGGQFSAGDLSLSAPAGMVAGAAAFKVSRSETKPPAAEYASAYSSLYLLEGPLNQLQGSLEVRFRVQPGALAGMPSSANSAGSPVTIYLEEDVPVPGGGRFITQVPLKSTYDAAEGVVRAQLTAPRRSTVGRTSSLKLASFSFAQTLATATPTATPAIQPTYLTSARIGLRYRVNSSASYFNTYFQSDHFTLWYYEPNIDAAVVEAFMQELEDQYNRIIKLGIAFPGLDGKIIVHITTTAFHGLFTPSVWSESSCGLVFNSAYFKNSKAYWEALEDLRTTAGHELMHYVFFLHDPRWPVTKALDYINRLWLEEAISTWYEPYTLDEPQRSAFTPENLQANINQIRNPMFFPSNEQEARHNGYSASIFLRYLTVKYNDPDLVRRILEQVHSDDSPYYNGGSALQAAFTQKQKATSLAAEWATFLDMRLFQAGRLFPGISSYSQKLLEKSATLRAVPLSGGNYEISFLPNNFIQPTLTKGTLFQGPSPTLKMQFELAGLSADGLEIRLGQDAGSLAFFKNPGKILISVLSCEGCGVLVYGMPVDTAAPPVLLAGPADYLLSRDEVRSNLIVDLVPGKMSGIWLIPFNRLDDPSMVGQIGRPVDISVSYQITPRATPTPTPKPSIPTPTPNAAAICSCIDRWLVKVYPAEMVKSCLDKGGTCVGAEVNLLTPYRPDLGGQFYYCRGGYEAFNLFKIDPKRRLAERKTNESILLIRAQEMCEELK